ncbi:MAG TPA: hypothetical protein VLE95_04705 [Chlamydiales bacterium]|nr:hypothetical protein [Chlamydiales bacterium]
MRYFILNGCLCQALLLRGPILDQKGAGIYPKPVHVAVDRNGRIGYTLLVSAAADCSGVRRGLHIRNAKVIGSIPVSGNLLQIIRPSCFFKIISWEIWRHGAWIQNIYTNLIVGS